MRLFFWKQDKLFGASRSSGWRITRKDHIKKHPYCEVCGKKGRIIANPVHHITPVHIDKFKELEPDNLITLCGKHHFLFGHLNSWHSWNENIKEDARVWRAKLKTRP